MEKLSKVVTLLTKGNSQDTKKLCKKLCLQCGKSFEYEVTYETHIHPPEFCNCNCEQYYEVGVREKKIKKIIPKKYWDIETDKTTLLNDLYDKSIFLTGLVGVGKTVLMASLAKKYIRDGKDVKWIKYPEFIMRLQNAYRKDNEETAFELAKEVAEFSGVLCIDDIGVSKTTDFVKNVTYYLLNEREQEVLPTLITSNYTLGELDEFIDSRVSSRIAGMCECVQVTGNDRRLE